jgi:lipopolysaccharide biosynthesis glycosyltransferase
MHIFTSITANYLPKAAALAYSVKRVHPEAIFHVVLCDLLPACASATTGAFDSIININELPIENLPSWIFKHRLVELCTAVKGTAFQHIADRFGAKRIYYFDPDIVVLGRLDSLERKLDSSSILLTPHLAEPETVRQAILDNEMCCLRHGVYNLGFLAVNTTGQGRRFIDWWADRLRSLHRSALGRSGTRVFRRHRDRARARIQRRDLEPHPSAGHRHRAL